MSDPPHEKKGLDWGIDFLAGTCGGAAGILVAQPFDVVKVLMQGPKAKYYSSNVFRALQKVLVEEGFRGFYKGMAAPLVSFSGLNCILFGVQGAVLSWLQIRKGVDSEESLPLTDIWKAGAIAGGVQTLVAAPGEYLKIQMQTQHLAHRTYKNNTDLIRTIFQKSGWSGFLKGFVITLFREIPSYGMYFGAYECICRRFGRSRLRQFVSGGLAGVICWAASYPIDVVKTRIQAQPVGGGLYRNWWDCARQSFRAEGVNVFGKGFLATIVRSFPLNGTTFLFYELTKSALYWLRDGSSG